MLEKLDVPLDHPRPGNIPPPPNSGSRWTSHPRDRRRGRVVTNRDFLSLGFREWPGASLAIALSGEQQAGIRGLRCLRAFDGVANSLGKLRNIRPPDGGD